MKCISTVAQKKTFIDRFGPEHCELLSSTLQIFFVLVFIYFLYIYIYYYLCLCGSFLVVVLLVTFEVRAAVTGPKLFPSGELFFLSQIFSKLKVKVFKFCHKEGCLFFQMIPLDSFVGQSADGKMVPIIPGGNSIPLTFSNRKEYVERAIEYRLHEIDRQVRL